MQDNPYYDDVPPHQIWLQKALQFWRYWPDETLIEILNIHKYAYQQSTVNWFPVSCLNWDQIKHLGVRCRREHIPCEVPDLSDPQEAPQRCRNSGGFWSPQVQADQAESTQAHRSSGLSKLVS